MYLSHAELPHTHSRYSELASPEWLAPAMCGFRGEMIHPHTSYFGCATLGLLPWDLIYTDSSFFFHFVLVLFPLAYFFCCNIVFRFAQNESRSHTFRRPGAAERLCEHAEAA